MKYRTVKPEYYEKITTNCPYCLLSWVEEFPSMWEYSTKKGRLARCENKGCKKLFRIKF